jgi:hypothetical protein
VRNRSRCWLNRGGNGCTCAFARLVCQVHPYEEWSRSARQRRLKYVEVRPAPTFPSDALRGRLADLVRERQALRDRRATTSVLEQNRLAIVQAQLQLAQALVSEHVEAVPA